jgi:hypothetical protein
MAVDPSQWATSFICVVDLDKLDKFGQLVAIRALGGKNGYWTALLTTDPPFCHQKAGHFRFRLSLLRALAPDRATRPGLRPIARPGCCRSAVDAFSAGWASEPRRTARPGCRRFAHTCCSAGWARTGTDHMHWVQGLSEDYLKWSQVSLPRPDRRSFALWLTRTVAQDRVGHVCAGPSPLALNTATLTRSAEEGWALPRRALSRPQVVSWPQFFRGSSTGRAGGC